MQLYDGLQKNRTGTALCSVERGMVVGLLPIYVFSWLLKPLEHTAPSIELTDPSLHEATHILPLAGYYFANSNLAEHALWSRATIQRLSNAYFVSTHQKPILLTRGRFWHKADAL